MSHSVFENPDGEPADPFDHQPGDARQPHDAAPHPIAAPPNHHVPEVEEILRTVIEIVETARPVPLSAAVKVEADQLLDLLYNAVERLPQELREARWLLRERAEYLQGVYREGDEIVAIARSQAERMVERTEVAKSAEQRAKRIIADAEAQSRLMRRETEDFCDARLASLEGILDRTRTVVATGRTRLQGTVPIDLTEQPAPIVETPRAEVFDQDFS